MAAMDTDEVSLPQALAAVQASFADAPGDAQAARQWAEGRGYDWGDSETLLAQFLAGEARCETRRKARQEIEEEKRKRKEERKRKRKKRKRRPEVKVFEN